MPQINHATFGGHLVRDPELRVTPSGTPVCTITIANNQKWKTESGEEREKVTFLDVTAWGKTGEIIAKFFTKGSPIIVWGRLDLDQWEDKNTKEKRSKIKLTVNFPSGGFDFCGGNQGGGEQQQNHQQQGGGANRSPERHAPPPRSNARPAEQENLDEDVPF